MHKERHPKQLASPEYPFQMIVMDYCNVKGKAWLVIADWFTGWVWKDTELVRITSHIATCVQRQPSKV